MTDRKRTPSLSASEARLYIVAVLASLYVIGWRALERPAPAVATPHRAPAPAPEPTPARAVWLDDVPVAERPALIPPLGWAVATRDAATAAPAQPVVRRPLPVRVTRPLRVRTRSS